MTLAAIDAFDQSIRNLGLQLSWPAEDFLRLLVAALAGGLVGIEREVRGRQAGFRTNLLVCVGSALIMIVSTSVAAAIGRTTPTSPSMSTPRTSPTAS